MYNFDENLLKERIRRLLRSKRTPIAKLADTDTLRVRFGRQINGEASVPVSTLAIILDMFTDISAEWLILGVGEMIKKEPGAQLITRNEVRDSSAGGNINVGTTINESSVRKLLKEKDARIAELEKDKALLQNVITMLTNSQKS